MQERCGVCVNEAVHVETKRCMYGNEALHVWKRGGACGNGALSVVIRR